MKEQTKKELLAVLNCFLIALLLIAGVGSILHGMEESALFIVAGIGALYCAGEKAVVFYKAWSKDKEQVKKPE